MPPRNLARQRGAVTILVAGMLAFTLLLTLFILILADGLAQRDLAQDAAETLARPALLNQMVYRRLGNDNTELLVSQLAAEADLDGQLRNVTITYVFGTSDGSNFIPINDLDPDPEETDFNAIALEVSSPLADFGVGIEIGRISGRHIFRLPPNALDECLCNTVCSHSGGLIGGLLCQLGCTIGSLLRDVLSLNLADLQLTLNCLGKALVSVAVDVWDWLWPERSVVITLAS